MSIRLTAAVKALEDQVVKLTERIDALEEAIHWEDPEPIAVPPKPKALRPEGDDSE